MLRFFSKYVKPVLATDVWTNSYGAARSLLAAGTLLTLLFNDLNNLFISIGGLAVPTCKGLSTYSLFCLFPSEYFWISKWIAIIILAIIVTGWRPRYTGVLHWWVSISFMLSAVTVDGGDQVTTVLTFLLIPVTITDDRKWHWSIDHSKERESALLMTDFKKIIAYTFYIIIRIQVAVIYFQSVIAKINSEQWMNGTALYYWFKHPWYGGSDLIMPLLEPFILSPVIVTFSTWGVILVELLLFCALFMPKIWWRTFLKIGIALHLGIALIHGLISFSIAMIAALILYLYPMSSNMTSLTKFVERIKSNYLLNS